MWLQLTSQPASGVSSIYAIAQPTFQSWLMLRPPRNLGDQLQGFAARPSLRWPGRLEVFSQLSSSTLAS